MSGTHALDTIAARYAAKSTTSKLCFAIENHATGFRWSYGDTGQPYFIASTTKLYTTALVMQLRAEGALALHTPVADLLGVDVMRGLNVHRGVDHGPRITVGELLAQTSGIPDYFEQKRADGDTLLGALLQADRSWTFEDTVEAARSLPGRFPPSSPGRAHYSDTNYQLLGRIIEVITGATYESEVRRRITGPLDLKSTYLFAAQTRNRHNEVAQMLYGRKPLGIPLAMGSAGADGGMVSTTLDGLRFLKAFFAGELFPNEYLPEMTAEWNRIFRPLEYGLGVMRFALPRYYSPTKPIPEMIGHSGLSGTVLFHIPKMNVYVSGTVNQVRKRSLAYQVMVRLVGQLQRSRQTG